MRNFLILAFTVTLILSCDKKVDTESDYQTHLDEQKCVFKKSPLTLDSVFPFNQADRIEIVSYDSLYSSEFMGGRITNLSLPNDSLGLVGFSKRVVLSKNQIDTIFSILYDYRFTSDSTFGESATCYNPRHAILFYKDNKLIEYLEICFECQQIEYIDKKSNFGTMCFDKWCFLIEYFKSCGMTKNFSDKNQCGKSPFTKG